MCVDLKLILNNSKIMIVLKFILEQLVNNLAINKLSISNGKLMQFLELLWILLYWRYQ